MDTEAVSSVYEDEDNDVDDGDIPPLEDFSELLESKLKIKPVAKAKVTDFLEPRKSEESTKVESVERLLNDTTRKATAKKTIPVEKKETSKSTFGGFQKGFLTQNKEKQGTKKITTLKASPKPKDLRVLPEVQESLKLAANSLNSKDWITPDLLKHIEDNPTLSKYLSDPNFSEVLSGMQRNPEMYQRKLQSDPQMMKAFSEFCGLMGQHFTSLGSKEKKVPGTRNASNEGELLSSSKSKEMKTREEDSARMQEALKDPEVQEILKDERIQQLFSLLKQNSPECQRLLQSADRDLHSKIQILIEKGLLGISR